MKDLIFDWLVLQMKIATGVEVYVLLVQQIEGGLLIHHTNIDQV